MKTSASTFGLFRNPILLRELTVAVRHGKIEWVVFVMVVGIALIIASVGGGDEQNPAHAGQILFQTFFGLAHGLVFLLGPTLAANSIASEREGRTWEALLLTGMTPAMVAVGKLMTVMALLGAYAVALAPVGALPFLFGGVSAWAFPIAYVSLFVAAIVAGLVGLALSSAMGTTRSSLIASAMTGGILAVATHYLLGESLGDSVYSRLHAVRPGTMWLPIALADGLLETRFAIVLLGSLALLCVFAVWFLFEVTVANISDVSADRTGGLKRWFAVSVAAFVALATYGATGLEPVQAVASVIHAIALFGMFSVFFAMVLLSDPVIAPRRVRHAWDPKKIAAWKRVLAPDLLSTVALQIVIAALALGVLSAVGLAVETTLSMVQTAPFGVLGAALAMAAYMLWVQGIALWTRMRFGISTARVVVAFAVMVSVAAPYALQTIVGSQLELGSLAAYVAAGSPVYWLTLAVDYAQGQDDREAAIAVLTVVTAYASIGLFGLFAGSRAALAQITESERALAEAEARFSRVSKAPPAVQTVDAKATATELQRDIEPTPVATSNGPMPKAVVTFPDEPTKPGAVVVATTPPDTRTLPQGTPAVSVDDVVSKQAGDKS